MNRRAEQAPRERREPGQAAGADSGNPSAGDRSRAGHALIGAASAAGGVKVALRALESRTLPGEVGMVLAALAAAIALCGAALAVAAMRPATGRSKDRRNRNGESNDERAT